MHGARARARQLQERHSMSTSCANCTSSASPVAARLLPRCCATSALRRGKLPAEACDKRGRGARQAQPRHGAAADLQAQQAVPSVAQISQSVALDMASGCTRSCARRGGCRTRRRRWPIPRIFEFAFLKFKTLDTIWQTVLIRSENHGSDTTVGIRITPPGEAAEGPPPRKNKQRKGARAAATRAALHVDVVRQLREQRFARGVTPPSSKLRNQCAKERQVAGRGVRQARPRRATSAAEARRGGRSPSATSGAKRRPALAIGRAGHGQRSRAMHGQRAGVACVRAHVEGAAARGGGGGQFQEFLSLRF
ncbi:titin-like [Dorcoceras hygrometricum]|uniref:Titin-like n=1 Tax=Dorcoceras hygrometricum TaxID=472368 RepID=A0A2Z7CUV5_9LAMI|nr:titin-like [Dorcoceras hygrometricum]